MNGSLHTSSGRCCSEGASSTGPAAWLVGDEPRLHLQHGPIDLIIAVDGPQSVVDQAWQRAHDTFQDVLTTLVAELSELRTPIRQLSERGVEFEGPVAQRMSNATRPYTGQFVTPMAAVAGAVADYLLESIIAAPSVNQAQRIMVNNGGDIAIYLSPHGHCRIGIATPDNNTPVDVDIRFSNTIKFHSGDGIGGVATSGWRGRSYSLGIADAVTVLADCSASADIAATLIANQVDVPASPRIHRCAASQLQCDSDLGERLVTCDVESLSVSEIQRALTAGATYARKLLNRGLIKCACLNVQGTCWLVSAEGCNALDIYDKNSRSRSMA